MLTNISLFKDISREDQTKLAQVGYNFWLSPGEILFNQGDPENYFYVVLEGAIRISRKIDNREIFIATYTTDTFFGEVPLLLGTPHLASGQAVNSTHIYCLHSDDFWQILITFPTIRKAVLSFMASRLQEMLMLSQHSEKLISLGTLAAGLAHELNNPISAARRATEQLRDTMQNRYTITLKQMEKDLTPVQAQHLLHLQHYAINQSETSNNSDPLEQIELEDQLTNWLDERGIVDSWKLAATFVAGGLTPEHLDKLDSQLEYPLLCHALTLLETIVTEANLLKILEHSTYRVSELVTAIKAYSYMDQALVKHKNLDVHEGLESTLTILHHKIKKHGLSVIRDYAQSVPKIQADGSALNQVWTNLIDNAIDAVEVDGTIWVRTSVDKDDLVVEIADNGVGVPPEILPRIFEPFFTTKEIGKGTGIGLSLAYRVIVGEHHGTISCFSQPGHTSFVVRLPICSH